MTSKLLGGLDVISLGMCLLELIATQVSLGVVVWKGSIFLHSYLISLLLALLPLTIFSNTEHNTSVRTIES